MHGVPQIRTFTVAEWASYRDLRLRALTDSPDAFGSTLALERKQTDDEWKERLTRGIESGVDHPLVAVVDGTQVGLAWVKVGATDTRTAHLYQMWVAPESRGAGVGRSLVQAAIDWTRTRNVDVLVLGVTCGDSPALRLYARLGFRPVGAPEPLRPGSALLAQTMNLRLDGSSV